MAQVVFSEVSPEAAIQQGTLFKGHKFWLSQKVPQRSRFIKDIRANGGEILAIEKHADIKIVDHARKEVLPGTYSYTFIEQSIRKGTLEDLQDHRAGPPEGTVRSVGSAIQPSKGTRNKYTQDDDRILWNWVHENPQSGGGTDGNEIYKQLETQHPQHPWQSWRDRWIKQLKGRGRPFPLPHNAPPTPPSDVPPALHTQAVVAKSKEPVRAQVMSVSSEPDPGSFTEEDAEALLYSGDDILDFYVGDPRVSWMLWAKEHDKQGNHTAREWENFWENQVRLRYFKRIAKKSENLDSRTAPTTPVRILDHVSPLKTSPVTMVNSKARSPRKSPSYRPESPSAQFRGPPIDQGQGMKAKTLGFPGDPVGLQEDIRLVEKPLSVKDETAKRKHVALEEEVPSSSPPESMPSPKRNRHNGPQNLREVASTPNVTPVRGGARPDLPLIIGSEDEESESDFDDESDVDESSLGKQPSETLSEPGGASNNTQAIFKENTQLIDLHIPPPNEGWDIEDQFSESRDEAIDLEIASPEQVLDHEDSGAETSSESEFVAGRHDPRATRQQTQAILRDDIAALDFDVAEPEGGWDNVKFSSPPPIPSSPVAESDVSDVGGQTEAWINSHVTQGIPSNHVISALKCTSMNTDLAEEVLEMMGKNWVLPNDKPGVWTEIDDEDLGSTDARKIQKLESKHGKDCLEARWDFLSFYNSA